MADKILAKLYKDTIEVVFTPGNHRYSVLDAGAKVYPLSVTKVTGVIDKSGPLMYWAVNLAVDYVKSYIDLETQPTKEEILKEILSVGRELKDSSTMEVLKGISDTIQNMNSNKLFSKNELENVLEQAKRQHTIYKKVAGDIGTQVHDLIETYVNAKINKIKFSVDEEFDPRVINGFNAFIAWEKENNIEYIAAEKLIYSKKYNYVGMTDCIAKVAGKIYILDWKTGKDVYNEMLLQVSAYGLAYEEETGIKIEGLTIAHFDKETGGFNTREITLSEYEECKSAFIHALELKKQLDLMEKRSKQTEEEKESFIF